ncbi:MAG: DegT/DnrJ/EryC1/StrS family aminotransferase [Bacteroidetes bacterium]|nr:DegT/DnrJ/EryC1/StrS family aminotransferase [Bacteroidota bacterium]MDA1335690.1 DegT/DnrJ/EryC1/StrS family aminotransferase [Bacteroidota bacterium]
MRNKRAIGFAPPPIDEDTITAVEKVLRSGWITSGPELLNFESELADYLNVKYIACFSSWTAACELALRWFDIGPGDEVILPAMTYAATANIVLHCGATPVLVDIQPHEPVVSADAIKLAWTARTKAIMPVDIGGWPVDYQAIMDWLNSSDVRSSFIPKGPNQAKLGRPLFLSDAAHSFGATIDEIPVGSQADITGFSFHAVKNLTTAEGGALAFALPAEFDMTETMKWFKSMSLHGQSKSALEKTESGNWQYDVLDAGFKCNMTDIQAAIGRSQLIKYPEQLLRRQAIAFRYHHGFENETWYHGPPLKDGKRLSAFHLFQIRIKNFTSRQRNEVMKSLKTIGIPTNVHFIPLPGLTIHKRRGEHMETYPNAQQFYEESISLPIHLGLSDEDVDWIVSSVIETVEAHL